jgi:tRNA-2-methylthio-N6-dimethylallyladenosine synthase
VSTAPHIDTPSGRVKQKLARGQSPRLKHVLTPKRYLVHTYGCQMNEHDSEHIAGLLEADGMVPATSQDDADVIVFNTCTIRENADARLYGNLGHIKTLKAERPELKIVVSGCMAQKDRELVQTRAPYVDVVFGTHNVHRAAELIRRSYTEGQQYEILDEAEEFPSALPTRRDEEWAAWVSIQIGCDNSCAFCIVPAVRGAEVSRPFGDLVDEVQTLAAAGTVEVTLLGQNVNSYGRDLTLAWREKDETDRQSSAGRRALGSAWVDDKRGPKARPLFADLLREVGAVEGIRRVRYTSPHPKDLRPETMEAMATVPTVMPHLHFPLQSGSDRVLTAMRRGYTAERYLEKLVEARRVIPDLAVTSDIIVGFPGETDEDFERTMEVTAAAEYDSAYTFQFSPRPGTAAAEMVDQFIAPDVMAERFARLKIIVERSALMKHQARIGRVEEVLVEGPSKKDASITSGRTRQNKLIHFTTPDAKALLPGTFCNVLVTGSAAFFLRGELVEITARHKHRIRIPVSAAH